MLTTSTNGKEKKPDSETKEKNPLPTLGELAKSLPPGAKFGKPYQKKSDPKK